MLRLTIRNLNAYKVRLGLTTFAVVLGVSFVVASFVLTDGFRKSFSTLSQDIVADVDLEVRSTSDFGSAPPLEDSAVDVVAGVDGVEHAAGLLVAEDINPTTSDGTLVTADGPPVLSSSWIDEPVLSQFRLREGRSPVGEEFTMEHVAASELDFSIGERYDIAGPTGVRSLELVGTTEFGDDNPTLGAVLMQFPTETIESLSGRPDTIDSVLITLAPEAAGSDVRSAIQDALTMQVEIRDNDQLIADTRADFNQGIDILNNVMLGFAVVSLFVSIFIIANTFAIVVGQRTGELALLRAIGATPAQVQRSTMLEALIIGVIASVVGILAGLALTLGLQSLFGALGADLPDAPIVLRTRTVIVAAVLGVGVTLAAASGPARRAATIAPMRAMQSTVEGPALVSRRRLGVGLGVLAAGIGAGSLGLFTNTGSTANTVALLGMGAALVFGAMTLVAPSLVRPIMAVLGMPLQALGASGRMSTQNAGRNPRRTASTAASLTVGLGLVTAALVAGESIKSGIAGLVDDSVAADVLIQNETELGSGTIERVASSEAFVDVTSYRYDQVMIGGDVETIIGTDLGGTASLFDIEVSDGALASDPNSVAVYRGVAEKQGLTVGDPVDVTFPSGDIETLTVQAIFDSKAILDLDWVLADNDWSSRFGSDDSVWAAAKFADGSETERADAAMAALEAEFPGLFFENRAEYSDGVAAEVDQMLVVINVLLALAVVIALLGIANTSALSVFERTREVGLLRAVGMSRRQVRQMFRWEAAQVSLLGATLGIAIGIVFGWGVVEALPDFFAAELAIPAQRLLVLAGICAVCGLVAAALPARRAARLNVIEALSTV